MGIFRLQINAMKKVPLALIWALCAFWLGACAHQVADNKLPADGNYVLFSLDGRQVDWPRPVDARLDNGQFGGNGPVNRWSGLVSDGQLGAIALTRMAGPADDMERERRLMAAIEGARLRVGPDGRLEFVRGDRLTAVFLPKSR